MTARPQITSWACDIAVMLLLLGWPVSVIAQHCQPGDGWNGLASDGVHFVVADSFASPVSGAVTNVTWRGGYSAGAVDCNPGTADHFEIRYRADESGVPGPVFAGPFRQSDGTLTVISAATGDELLDGIAEYLYQATHAAVPITENQCYWLELRNVRGDGCDWYWETSELSDRRAAQDATPNSAFDEFDLLASDMAFCLNIPLYAPVECALRPQHDDCHDAIPISDGEHEFSTMSATTGGGEDPSFCYAGASYYNMNCCASLGIPATNDVWFLYTPICSAALSVDVCDGDFDSKITLYQAGFTACPVDYAYISTCNDDGCGTQPGGEQLCAYQKGVWEPCWSMACRETVRALFPECSPSAFQWNQQCQSLAELLCTDSNGLQSSLVARVEAGREYGIRVGSSPVDLGGDLRNDPICRARICEASQNCCTGTWNEGSSCERLVGRLCLGQPGHGTLRVKLVAPPPYQTNLRHVHELLSCASAPCSLPPCETSTYAEPCCLVHDFDNDGDVDAFDLTEHLVPAMTGP